MSLPDVAPLPTGSNLDAALDRLVAQGVLDEQQARAVAAELGRTLPDAAAVPTGLRGRLAELAGYVGGALVVAAALVFMSAQWADLDRPLQIGLLIVATVILAVAGVVAGRVSGDVRRRLGSTFWCGAGLTAAFAAGTAIAGPDVNGAWPALGAGLAGLAVAASGYRLSPSVLGQLACAAAAVTGVLGGLGGLGPLSDGNSGVSGVVVALLGLAWYSLARMHLLREHRFGLTLACALIFLGGQIARFDDGDAVVGTNEILSYVLTGAAAAAALITYSRIRFWGLLAVGVVAVTTVVTEIALDLTEGSLGASGAMLVAGVTLLVASAVGLRLHRT